MSGIRRFTCWTVAVVCTLTIGSSAARAQGIGFQGGVGLDPSQAYVGTHVDLPLAANIFFRPSIEGASGGGVSEALIDATFIYSFPLGPLSPWSIYQGTGPVIVIERVDDQLHPHGGFAGVFGVAHTSGFFFEFKLSGGGGPNLRMGIGYTLRHKTP
ncbi:MAG: hypothetical protein HY047_09965 [Acidobacteria bacterium]|nr:hypothetical protein [Acidobacteriota bacterium]